MTPPTLTPAEQLARFIERHPGEWRGAPDGRPGWVLPIAGEWHLWLYEDSGWINVRLMDVRYPAPESPVPWRWPEADRDNGDILARVASRAADAMPYGDELGGCSADTLPPWLADPVRHQLINRARVLLTSAGISPADAVMAAETLDEALCQRPVVEVTGILPTLMSLGMSCRWATGANEAKDDYVGFVSRRLAAVAGERDGLRAAIKQAVADLDAYSETDKGVRIATLPARATLRRVLGVT